MTDRLTILHICDILKSELSLSNDRIWIYNQKQDIPTAAGLFIAVGQMSIVPYGSNRRFIGATEKTSQMFQEVLTIEAYSRDTSALSASQSIISALNSTLSIQTQERYGFKIAEIPSTINDTSFLESTAILYRVSLTIRVLRAYESQKDIQYYETFSNDILTED